MTLSNGFRSSAGGNINVASQDVAEQSPDPIKLSLANLDKIVAAGHASPLPYDPKQVTASHIHVGAGAFASAHIFEMVHDILAKRAKNDETLNLGIIGVSLKRPTRRDAIKEQDFLYTLMTKGRNGISTPEIIGCIKDILVASENANAVLEAAASKDITTITTTVTEKGYYLDPNKKFQSDHPDIKACMDRTTNEMSTIGLIVNASKIRMDNCRDPFEILALDNTKGENATDLRSACLAYVRLAYGGKEVDDLSNYIEEMSFINTMVDRITPKTTPEHTQLVHRLGIDDGGAIQTEERVKLPLVIGINPDTAKQESQLIKALKEFGVVVTDDIAAFKALKIRTLNAAHTAMGAIGYLLGYQHSHEAMSDPNIEKYLTGFMQEAGKTLHDTPGLSHQEFRDDVASRLHNPEICDQLTRLFRDGSNKVGQRFIGSMKDIIASEEGHNGYPHLAFALAAWIQTAKDLDENGKLPGQLQSDDPHDANAAKLRLVEIITPDLTDPSSIFSIKEIFGNDLAENSEIIRNVKQHLTNIQGLGIKQALNDFVKTVSIQAQMAHNIANDDSTLIGKTRPVIEKTEPQPRVH